ncbi:MAG: hypothetical protein EOS23_31670 [Mesorhizobium sp.]|nr:MAG: hypothetical protein EOS23_31670 [Mesorhizobium sp.]
MTSVARDSFEAWSRLCAAGGLELDDRDADFGENLRIALAPSAATLEEALRSSSTDHLVRAVFDLAEPFVAMFRAILSFFQAAGVQQGRSQWDIHIEEEHFELKHFEKFLETWNALDCEVDVPAIDSDGASAILRAGDDLIDAEWRAKTGVPDVDHWQQMYHDRGLYLPFPRSLHANHVSAEFRDAISIATVLADSVRRAWPDRETMMRDYWDRRLEFESGDGFNLGTIAQHETDFQLGFIVAQLGRYVSLHEASQRMIGQRLAIALSRYPRRKIGIRAELPELERILSLPIWQRRHELYAVWIATEIVNALEDHDCALHHEKGRITFAFRESVIATVRSSHPKVRLFAERRSPLIAPIGHGRTGHVQPDYSLWRRSGDREECGLVIEVKHYKRGSPARFREALIDYARAHRAAKVLLVNHGPARESFHAVDSDVSGRCIVIGDLTPSHLRQRETLKEIVRDYVGEPVFRRTGVDAGPLLMLAVDVSASMSAAIDAPDFAELLSSVAEGSTAAVALVDSEIQSVGQIDLVTNDIGRSRRGHTSLHDPISSLLEDHERVVLLTDRDGIADLVGFKTKHLGFKHAGGIRVEVIEIER